MNMQVTLPGLISLAVNAIICLIIIDVIISYCIMAGVRLSPYNSIVRGVRMIVNPILNPIRRLMPPPSKTGGWDFAPMIAILLLNVLQNIVLGSLNIGAAR